MATRSYIFWIIILATRTERSDIVLVHLPKKFLSSQVTPRAAPPVDVGDLGERQFQECTVEATTVHDLLTELQ